MTAVNSAASARPRAGRQLPFFAVLVGALFMALATASTIATLRAASDSSRRAQALVASLEATVHAQTALELGAIAAGGLTPAQTADLQAARGRVNDLLELLAQGERSSFGLPALRAALDTYRAAVEEQLSALGAGDTAEAAAIERAAVGPARESFLRVRQATEAQLDESASDSAVSADVGTLSALLSAAILVSLLFRRWERTRRRSAFLVGEQHGLRASEARFRGLVQHSSDLITVVDRGGLLNYVSPSASRLVEAGAGGLIGSRLADLIHPDDQARLDDLLALPTSRLAGRIVEWRFKTGDGWHLREGWRTFESVVSTVDPTDPASAIILNSRDVTERRELEESLRHQAGHDPLTGLVNRPVLLDALERALARAGRTGFHVGLLFIDLDDFKAINDTSGHAAGDAALVEIAARIRRAVRADGVVARLGGDEFAILLEDLTTEEQAATVAERIHEAVERPVIVGGNERLLAASIGIALSTRRTLTGTDLINAADSAMYQAKRAGGGRFVHASETPKGGPATQAHAARGVAAAGG